MDMMNYQESIDAFSPGETQDITFARKQEIMSFQCDPHEGAGMKGVIHVQ